MSRADRSHADIRDAVRAPLEIVVAARTGAAAAGRYIAPIP